MLAQTSQRAATTQRFPRLQLPKLELLFRDGSSIWLHQTRPDLCVRGIDVDGERIEVDLRDIAPSLDSDLVAAASPDRAGVMFFTLRHQFNTVGAFLQAAREHAR